MCDAWTRRTLKANPFLATNLSTAYLKAMPVKQTIPHNYGIFFITITCHKWLSLIEQTTGYDAEYKWFDHLKSKGHCLAGYYHA